ncbi:unnamed protein product [Rhizophagus irregularis]|nr:unnamed protein product [Rhizophagus irregularis]
MPRYSAKRQTSAFLFYDYAKFYVLLNISASSDRTEMHNSSFESSQCNDSNKLQCIPVQSLDAEIFGKTSKIGSGGLPKNGKRRTFKIRQCLPKNRKNQDSFSGLPKNNGKPRFVSGSLEKVEPKFINTNLGLVSQMGSDKQKKTKDS